MKGSFIKLKLGDVNIAAQQTIEEIHEYRKKFYNKSVDRFMTYTTGNLWWTKIHTRTRKEAEEYLSAISSKCPDFFSDEILAEWELVRGNAFSFCKSIVNMEADADSDIYLSISDCQKVGLTTSDE